MPTTGIEPSSESHRRPFGAIALPIAVVFAGAAVMIYEFVAVRILTRYFGGSLDVWASVIAVLLAGLCAGYALGGLLADRFGTPLPIAVALVVAGVTGALMEKITTAVAGQLMASSWGMALHPYLASAAVTLVPTIALGTVVPQAIRLRAQATRRVGRAAGWTSALSTLGSILGVLLTVHVLLTRIGVRETLYGTSVVLVIMGLALLFLRSRPSLLVLTAACLLSLRADADVIYEDYSAYHHILVEDVDGSRRLRFDDSLQSTMSLDDPNKGGFEYTDFFHVPLVLNPTASRVLFLGLGGATGPKAFLHDYPQMKIEVAEIDPRVEWVAREYFGLPKDKRLNVDICDGRVYLQRSRHLYGAIIMDAYASGPYGAYLPYHLVTQEFCELAWKDLENGGCLVFNVIGAYRGELGDVVQGIYNTLSSVFQAVYVFRAASSVNTVFVAQRIDAGKLRPDGARDGLAWPAGPWLRHPLTAKEFADLAHTLTAGGLIKASNLERRVTQFSGIQGVVPEKTVFTDNFAPVDIAPGKRRASSLAAEAPR